MEETGATKKPVAAALTIDRAAFLLLRVKKAFKKKKQQRKDKNVAVVQEALGRSEGAGGGRPPPLLRSRTLPAIVVPGLSILQAQIDARFGADGGSSTCSSRRPSGLRLSPRPSVVTPDSRRGSANRLSPRVSLSSGPDLDITEDGTVVLRVPGPHVVAARAYRMSLSSSPSPAAVQPSSPAPPPLQRLARLLSATPTTPSPRVVAPAGENDDSGTRRLSWERRDAGGRMGRSSSIDSLVEAVWSSPPQPVPVPRPASPAGRRTKAHRGIAEKRRNANPNFDDGLRRSRSVRASLRMIGNRWKNQKQSDAMRINHSFSDPEETKSRDMYKKIIRSDELYSDYDWKKTYKDADDAIYSEMEVKELAFKPPIGRREINLPPKSDIDRAVDLILRNSTDKLNKIDKREKFNILSRGIKQKDSMKDDIFQIPATVPPKAAALLHIPVAPASEAPADNYGENRFLVNGSDCQGPGTELTGMGPPLGTNRDSPGPESVQYRDRRCRRGSEGEGSAPRQIFSFYSPPKDRKNGLWMSEQQLKIPVGVTLEAGGRGAPPQVVSAPAGAPAALPAIKMTKKQSKQAQAQLEKLAKINIHLHALFAAVEHDHLEKARTILESTDVDVNSLNTDGLSPLDVAVLGNNRPLAKMLLSFGAHEGNQFKNVDSLGGHLRRLSQEAEGRLQEIVAGGGIGGITLGAPPPPRSQGGAPGAGAATGCAGQGADQDKQLHHWERRTKALSRMLLGWRQTKPPNLPCSPELDVTSPSSVTIRIRENMSHQQNQPIITKYRVEWSSRADFSNVCGEHEICAAPPVCSCSVTGLTRGRRYFFRAQGGNLKGWGPFNTSTPNSVLPSSWRDVEGRASRFDGRATRLERVAAAARLARGARPSRPAPPRSRRPRHAIRHLFTAASKFHKNLRRGVYLACIIYHEDKVLVTNEDFLPVIEIDETYPACIYTDYHWLMKVACTWEDVKSLRSDMEKNASSAIHFRTKLLAAAAQMQSALCIQDLGQLYHKPLRDSHGTLVISCINSVKSPKSVSVLNSRWMPLNKVHKKLTVLSEDNTIGDLLMGTIQEQIHYHQLSSVKLPRGLYLGYLKLQSSVDLIQVVVPSKAPNVLPHWKMRDNSHVSAEEWDYLKQQQSKSSIENQTKNSRRMSITSIQSQSPTESQQMFLDLVISTAKKLFKYMDIPLENALTHRIYDLEVIDLSSDVSFIVICPPAEQACSVPGQKEILLQRGDLLSLPIQAFEMIHLNTYQNSIINKYSKLSCILELDTVLANHSHREAFSNSELQTAKDRLAKLQELQNSLNAVWKDSRWLMDVISFARDKDKLQGGTGCNNIGIQLKNLINRIPTTVVSSEIIATAENILVNSSSNSNLKRTLLQLPPRDPKLAKSSPGRGSWPGPNATSPLAPPGISLLSAEFSKSEQHLSILPRNDSVSTLNLSGSQYLSATSDMLSVLDPYSRKSSADSQFTHSSIVSNNYFPANQPVPSKVFEDPPINQRLPPSRSQDTLLSQPNSHVQRRKSTNLNSSLSATSSPLLNVKPFYASSMASVHTANTTNTSDSMHSMSSDSEGQSFPISTSTPNRSKSKKSHKSKKHDINISSSKSMSNVKCSLDFTDAGQANVYLKPTTYLKPTLNAIQSESEFSQTNSEHSETRNKKSNDPFFCETNIPPKDDKSLEQRLENKPDDERSRSIKNDVNKASTRHASFTHTKVLQHNELSDLASSSDGSRYSSHSSLREQSLNSESLTVKNISPGILQVYAAYETGLASGTSLKLHVTPRTSAREVVDLVVKQLNMAVVLKGKDGPIYTSDKLKNFCLVAVIGARERCLRDDFKPLQLQNPWRKGRLYVRQKHEVLAALEHSSKQAAFI